MDKCIKCGKEDMLYGGLCWRCKNLPKDSPTDEPVGDVKITLSEKRRQGHNPIFTYEEGRDWEGVMWCRTIKHHNNPSRDRLRETGTKGKFDVISEWIKNK